MAVFLQQVNDEDLNFCPIIIMIDHYHSFTNNNTVRRQWAVKHELSETFESLTKYLDIVSTYCLDIAIKNGLVGIVSFGSQSTEKVKRDLFDVCNKLRLEAKKILQMHTVTCTVGPVCKIDDISSSFEKALSDAQYRFFLGNDTTITSELVKSIKNIRVYDIFPYTHLLEPLFVAVKEYNVDNLSQALDDIFDLLGTNTSKSDYNSVYFKILSEQEKIMNEIGLYSNDSYRHRLNMLYEQSFETLELARDTLFEFMLDLSIAYNRFKASSLSKDLYSNLLSYIEHNYTDPSLSLSSIADTLSFNPSYLTRFFKERNGMSLMQYVDKMRLDKAKEMLITSDHNIKKIVGLVGYTDEANFFRKFKKKEGISPSQFRDLERQQ